MQNKEVYPSAHLVRPQSVKMSGVGQKCLSVEPSISTPTRKGTKIYRICTIYLGRILLLKHWLLYTDDRLCQSLLVVADILILGSPISVSIRAVLDDLGVLFGSGRLAGAGTVIRSYMAIISCVGVDGGVVRGHTVR